MNQWNWIQQKSVDRQIIKFTLLLQAMINKRSSFSRSTAGTKKIPSLKGCYMSFFEQLYNAILKEQAEPVSANEALDVIKIIRLCEKSNELKSVLDCKQH